MKEIIEWLIRVERMAGGLYRDAASFFKEDKELAAFLGELGEDEAWHFHIMGSASEFLRGHPEVMPAQIILDDAIRVRLESPFIENQEKLAAGQLTEESILSCITATEFSEWNDLFLYVVNSLKEESREFQYVAARIQGHLKHIMDFLATRPEGLPFLNQIRQLPKIWREKVLIVEDSPPLAQMLEKLFSRLYNTAVAENGSKGLEKIKGNYVDVIVSDIDMPEMDGITFFQEATRHDPDIGSRFLFFSGFIADEQKAFIDAHHVPYLLKPSNINDLQRQVAAILEKNGRSSLRNNSG